MKLRIQIVLLLGLIALTWAGYVAVLGPRILWVPALMLGFLGAVFLLLLVSAVLQVVRSLRERRLLAEVGPPRREGFCACSGLIVALDGTVDSPLEGSPCSAWEYEFQSHDLETEWSGIGQVAMAVESEGERVPIRGGVLIESLAWHEVAASQCRESAAALAARPEVRSIDGALGAAQALGELEQLLDDADGNARLDWRRGPERKEFEPRDCRERRLEPGTRVTVLGHYSLAQRAFVATRRGLELRLGSAETLRKDALRKALGVLGFALATNLLIQGLAVLAYVRAPG